MLGTHALPPRLPSACPHRLITYVAAAGGKGTLLAQVAAVTWPHGVQRHWKSSCQAAEQPLPVSPQTLRRSSSAAEQTAR